MFAAVTADSTACAATAWFCACVGRAATSLGSAVPAGSAVMVYALLALGGWQWLYQAAFAGWMTPLLGPYLPSLAFALAYVALWWGVVRWMDQRGWHIRI